MSVRHVVLGGCVLAGRPRRRRRRAAARVRVDTVEGRTVTGRLLTAPVRLENEYGIHDIGRDQIRRITFRPREARRARRRRARRQERDARDRAERLRLFDRHRRPGSRRSRPEALREIKAVAHPPVGPRPRRSGCITLAAMEIVLGIDNIIFLAIVAGKLPEAAAAAGPADSGCVAALGTRILLLCSLSFLLGLTKPLFTIPEMPYFHDAGGARCRSAT